MTSRTVAVDVTMNGISTINGIITHNNTTTTSARIIKRTATSSNYTVLVTDYLIGCDSSGGAIIITLPLASVTANQTFYIVDEKGSAGLNAITIATDSGESNTLNGELNQIINTNYSSIQIYSDGGTGYHIM
jgi:hypothetical protein